MFASRELPERYEWWLYPVLGALTIAWRSYPLHFYWSNLLGLETLLFTLGGLLEVWQFHKKRPWVALIILMALSAGLSFALFNQGGSAKLLYWIMIGLFAYLWLLGKGSELFDQVLERLFRRK
jgi:hypothetical protein